MKPPYSVLGIDPGTTGGIVEITQRRDVIEIRFAKRTKLDVFNRIQFMAGIANLDGSGVAAFKENMSARPGQSTQAVMQNGRSHQFACDLCEFNEIPYHLIDAKTWQFEFGLGGRQYKGAGWNKDKEYRERKRAHHRKATELFGAGITQDIADAYLIAEYGWRLTFGEMTNGKDSTQPRRMGNGLVGPNRSQVVR